jgi:hypothetical protein
MRGARSLEKTVPEGDGSLGIGNDRVLADQVLHLSAAADPGSDRSPKPERSSFAAPDATQGRAAPDGPSPAPLRASEGTGPARRHQEQNNCPVLHRRQIESHWIAQVASCSHRMLQGCVFAAQANLIRHQICRLR